MILVGTHALDDDGYCVNHETFCVVKGMLNVNELAAFIDQASWEHSPIREDLE